MNRISVQSLTVSQLVDRFTALALEQYEAERHGDTARFNRLFDEVVRIKDELAGRAGDQRSALVTLFDHPNPQVRLNAAQRALAVAPVAARQALQRLWDNKEFPQAAYAHQTLTALDEGASRLS